MTSSLRTYIKVKTRPNPKMPARTPWQEVIQETSNQDFTKPKKADAFTGLTPAYAEDAPPVGQGRKGLTGRRRARQWCGDEVVKWILLEDNRRLADALCQQRESGLSINVRATRGLDGCFGAPYAFGMTAVWAQEQMHAVQKELQQNTRHYAHITRRFYHDEEWEKIDHHLDHLGDYAGTLETHGETRSDYARRGRFVVDLLVLGDSLLHLAVREGSLCAALVLFDFDIDSIAVNSAGQGAIELLEVAFDKVRTELEAVVQLRYMLLRQARANHHDDEGSIASSVLSHLKPSKKEQAVLDREPLLVDKWEAAHRLARALLAEYQQKSAFIEQLELQQWKAQLEGLPPDPEKFKEIEAKERVGQWIDLCARMVDASLPPRRPGWLPEPVIPDNTEAELTALSGLRFDEHEDRHLDLDGWFGTLEHAAVAMQTMWRGFRVRQLLLKRVQHRAAIDMERIARGFIMRRRVARLRAVQQHYAHTQAHARDRELHHHHHHHNHNHKHHQHDDGHDPHQAPEADGAKGQPGAPPDSELEDIEGVDAESLQKHHEGRWQDRARARV